MPAPCTIPPQHTPEYFLILAPRVKIKAPPSPSTPQSASHVRTSPAPLRSSTAIRNSPLPLLLLPFRRAAVPGKTSSAWCSHSPAAVLHEFPPAFLQTFEGMPRTLNRFRVISCC